MAYAVHHNGDHLVIAEVTDTGDLVQMARVQVEDAMCVNEIQGQRDRLLDIISELMDAWDDYEMLAALDIDIQRRAEDALRQTGRRL